jgi:ribosome maturation factor RimP
MMKLLKILEQTIPGLGYELVDVEFSPAKLIRVFIEKSGGGVSVEDCALVSNHLSKVLQVEEIDYNRLEISSPGLERPLKRLADYTRFNGRLVKVKTIEPYENQKVFHGNIREVVGENITLELEDKKFITVAFSQISRARLLFEPKKS